DGAGDGVPDSAQRGGGTGVTGMWMFLATDAMGFGGLFIAYGILRVRADVWPDPRTRLALAPAGGMTFAPLGSQLYHTVARRGGRDDVRAAGIQPDHDAGDAGRRTSGAPRLVVGDSGAGHRISRGRGDRVRAPRDGGVCGSVRVDVLSADRVPRPARAGRVGGGRVHVAVEVRRASA